MRLELLRADRLLLHALESRAGLTDDATLARELVAEHGSVAIPHATLEPRGVLPGLERARHIYQLSPLEREALLLALLPELDERYGRLLARLQGDSRRRITVGLAARWLDYLMAGDRTSALAALGPHGHLYRTGLIDLLGDGPLPDRMLAIPASFWPALIGAPVRTPVAITPKQDAALAQLALHPETRRACEASVAWAQRRNPHECLFVIDGAESSGRTALASAVASALGYQTLQVAAEQLTNHDEIRGVAREAAWHFAAVVVRGAVTTGTLGDLAREIATPVFACGGAGVVRELAVDCPRSVITIPVLPLEQPERAAIWARLLADTPHDADIDPQVLAAKFRFRPREVCAVIRAATLARDVRGDSLLRAADVANACRSSMENTSTFATRLDCPYDGDDIVLPPATRRELALISAWAQHGATAFLPGGPGARIKVRGGLVALFSGPPGTGKTMAAQVIARSLQLALLRIDLSEVVSKYIGETEKNLERVFTEAEASGAILFFDEADALFGKRTAVSDAHDRYANLETAYLLQRLERHPGIVLLATNLLSNLDAAFLRRVQVVAEFPMPGPSERTRIWQRHLAADHIAEDVQLAQLGATFPLSGGDIRNAAITAVLLAASERAAISMHHLVIGIWRELRKTGRMVSPDDFGAWRDVVISYARGG